MKIRFNENIVIFFDIFFGILLLLMASFAYFFGFPVNSSTLPFYFITLFSIFSLVVVIYLAYRLLSKTYYIFTKNEIIKGKKDKTNVLIKYKDILSLTYYNVFNLLIGDPKGGNLVVEFKDENNKSAYIYIPISNRKLRKLKARRYRI